MLSLLRGGKVCRASTPTRTVPTGPRVGGFALVVLVRLVVVFKAVVVVVITATVVVDLTGALPRVRAGAVRLTVVFWTIVSVVRVVEVHLPSAQVGVVLPGAVRAGTEVVASSGARDTVVRCPREGGAVLVPRGPVLASSSRGACVADSGMRGRPLSSSEDVRGENVAALAAVVAVEGPPGR